MALSNDDIYNLLKEFNKYGATIYYLLSLEKIKLDDINSILFKKSIEQVALVFPKFISKIKTSDVEDAYSKYSLEYTKLDCLDTIISKQDDKYSHLNEIRNIVNFDSKLDSLIKDNTYYTVLNTKYTGLILDMIEIDKSNSFISIRETVKLYKEALEKIKLENEKKLTNNIDNYYISSITN